MALADKDHRNISFITRVVVFAQQIYRSVKIQENSHSHQLAATASFQCQNEIDISTLLSNNQKDE